MPGQGPAPEPPLPSPPSGPGPGMPDVTPGGGPAPEPGLPNPPSSPGTCDCLVVLPSSQQPAKTCWPPASGLPHTQYKLSALWYRLILTSRLGLLAPCFTSAGCLMQGLASRSPILLADHHLSLSAEEVHARDTL